jgi:hypothetical protein
MASTLGYPFGSYVISPEGLRNLTTNTLKKQNYPGQHFLWTEDIKVELPIRLGPSGMAA